MIAIEEDAFTAALGAWAKQISKPSALVVMSAHWEAAGPLRVNTGAAPGMIHDFGGFPDALYEINYPAPGNPELAQRIVRMLSDEKIPVVTEPKRGFDHGVWTPLRRVFPDASIPLVQISLPMPRRPREILRMGKALAPLRDEGGMLIGTGGVVHNLRLIRMGAKDAPVDPWAKKFDEWVKEHLETNDVETLANYQRLGPHADLAAPTPEHFDPLFFPLGAAAGEPITFVYEGFHYGNLSMRTFALGEAALP